MDTLDRIRNEVAIQTLEEFGRVVKVARDAPANMGWLTFVLLLLEEKIKYLKSQQDETE